MATQTLEEQAALFPRGSPERAAITRRLREIDTSLTNPIASAPRARRAIAPILEASLGPALAQAVGRQLGRPGATIEGVLSGLSITGGLEVSRELSGIQNEILAARQNLKAGAPRVPNVGGETAKGAAQGFLAGGLPGAVAGAFGGGIGAVGGKKRAQKIGIDIEKQTAQASSEASPEAFAAEAAKEAPAAREVALAGGAGARRAQDLEAAITASGLRDTGIGTLASIAAGVQVPLEGLAQTFGGAIEEVTRQAARTLGQPINAGAAGRSADNIARALEGLATIFLTRGQPGSASNPIPATRIPESQGFGTPLIPQESAFEQQTDIFGRPGVNF